MFIRIDRLEDIALRYLSQHDDDGDDDDDDVFIIRFTTWELKKLIPKWTSQKGGNTKLTHLQ
jgi:hypothetical protein